MTSDTLRIPLHLGPLAAEGFAIQRSGIRWLCEDGHLCRAGEVVAYCNIGVAAKPGYTYQTVPFRDEFRDLRVALAPRRSGRLIQAQAVSRGGWHDLLWFQNPWSPETTIGYLECPAASLDQDPAEVGRLRMLLLAGRRWLEFAEVRGDLLSGWFDRTRAWWADGPGPYGNILSIGICDQIGLIRGERWAFCEFLEQAPGPAHVAFVADDLMVPSAAVLSSQLRRTKAERERIVEDFATTFQTSVAVADQGPMRVLTGWTFAAALLKGVCRSPLEQESDVLTANGVVRLPPPAAVILSLASEGTALRHKRLGYLVQCHPFRVQAAGPLIARWLQTDFEKIPKTPDDSRRDLLELIDLVKARTKAHILVLNHVSSGDDPFCYSMLDRPLWQSVASIRHKELNLLLWDVARQRDISVIDIDALAADFGTRLHIPDGLHPSGPLQNALRVHLVKILHDRGVPGF